MTTTTSPPPERVQGWVQRAVLAPVALSCLVVIVAPLALSFHSLEGWGREAMGLDGPWPYLVPLALDAAAVAYVGIAFYCSLRGESAGMARLLVWVIAGASAAGNWRHGIETSTDAAVFHAAMPISAAVLLEVVLRLVKRLALADKGALEAPLPRYRVVRWVIAPRETWRAWCWAARHGITDPLEALEASRRPEAAPAALESSEPALSPAEADDDSLATSPAEPDPGAALRAAEGLPGDLPSWTKTEAIRLGLDRLAAERGYDGRPGQALADGAIRPAEVHTWLAQRGVTCNANHVSKTARQLRESARMIPHSAAELAPAAA